METEAPAPMDTGKAIVPAAEDTENAVVHATEDPENAVVHATEDPENAVVHATEDPENAVVHATEDPENAVVPATEDTENASVHASVDTENAIESATVDVGTAIDSATVDVGTAIDSATVNVETVMDSATVEVETAIIPGPVDMETDSPMGMETASPMGMETAVVPVTPASPVDDNEDPSFPETQPTKRRRKKSMVWEHFTEEKIGPGHTRARCNQCKHYFAYITNSKMAGTSHLMRHITLGICPMIRDRGQLSPLTPASRSRVGGVSSAGTDPPKRRYRRASVLASTPVDQDRCNHEIAKMIILHEYPLNIVEHQGFVDFARTLHPQYNVASFNTVQGDCVALYLEEKRKLLDLISSIPGHVNLILDLWTSNQSLGYIVLTGHFIDSDWNLQRRLLNVAMVPSPDSEHAFNQAVVTCLSDWRLDTRLFTLTIDQLVPNENILENLRGLLSVRNPLVLDGQLVVRNCFARVLSRLAQEALGSMEGTVKKIRYSVKYVKTSEAHDEKFDELRQHVDVECKRELSIDDQTKWNTTYNMLVAAYELRQVFAYFDASNPGAKLNLSMDEWKEVEILCSYLKIFHDAASLLTATPYPTTNIFFHEVSKIQLELTHAASSEDPFVSNLVKPLLEKFDKYWKDVCLVLAIAVVMDPRFKMKLVEFSFSRIYGDDAENWTTTVDDGIHELYLDYMEQMLSLPAASVENGDDENTTKTDAPKGEAPQEGATSHEELQMPQDGTLISFGDGLTDFDVYISEITSNQETRSELDQYLEESLLPRVQEFDVLGWWKLNQVKYPVLSKMAADILSIPMCILPPESIFDTRSNKIDRYRGSLRPVTLEALMCAKDWLQHKTASLDVPNGTLKSEV